MKKKRFLLILAFIVAVVAPIAPRANAGNTLTPNNAQYCSDTRDYETRVCFDLSLNRVYVYAGKVDNSWSWATYMEYFAVPISTIGQPGLPSIPWRADDYECNAGAGNITTFRINNTYTFTVRTKNFGELIHAWNAAPVSAYMRDIIAFSVNVNGAGGAPKFECIVVP